MVWTLIIVLYLLYINTSLWTVIHVINQTIKKGIISKFIILNWLTILTDDLIREKAIYNLRFSSALSILLVIIKPCTGIHEIICILPLFAVDVIFSTAPMELTEKLITPIIHNNTWHVQFHNQYCRIFIRLTLLFSIL